MQGWGQVPVKKGAYATQTGTFHYDEAKAEDRRVRRYLYSVCPENARCLSMDFNLFASKEEKDFIRVFDGKDTLAPLLKTLGGKSGSLFLQSESGCLCFEFMRDREVGLYSTWTARWASDAAGDCIEPESRNPDCPEVEEICGPVVRRQFPPLRDQHELLEKAVRYNVSRKKIFEILKPEDLKWEHAAWYKLRIQKSGMLSFSILPANGYDNLDWALFKDPSQNAIQGCPDPMELKLEAINLAQGRGMKGGTGLSERGGGLGFGWKNGNPYCEPVQVSQGDLLYLLINDPGGKGLGYSIRFNEVVLDCKQEAGTFVPVAFKPKFRPPLILPKDVFSRRTRVERISFREKHNEVLISCSHKEGVVVSLPYHKIKAGRHYWVNDGKGLILALMKGMLRGEFSAWSPTDLSQPVHFGDLLGFLYPLEQYVYGEIMENMEDGPYTLWFTSPDLFVGFEDVMEVVYDEVFDKRTGSTRRVVRFLRLLWVDPADELPSYAVAVFRWQEVRDLLKKITVGSDYNDASGLNLASMIEEGMYTGFPVRTGAVREGMAEMDEYRWER